MIAMSNITRHYGTLVATGSRCFVAFRELPDNPTKALIIYRDSLPEMYAIGLTRIVDGVGQNTKDLYEVLSKEATVDGTDYLTTLHNLGKLHSVDTKEITMQVTPSYNVSLNELNDQLRNEVPTAVSSDTLQAKLNPYGEQNTEDSDINATGIAENLLLQAQGCFVEGEAKRARAYELRPELKPAPVVTEAATDSASTFSVDLGSMSQKKAIELLQEQWRAVNPKVTKPKG